MKKILPLLFVLCFALPLCAQEPQAENGLTSLMKKHGLNCCTAQATPTICLLCGIEAPKPCIAKPLDEAVALAKNQPKVEKVLIFCPDATGKFVVDKYPEDWKPLIDSSTFTAVGTNVLPSVTPVCFGAIFTGCPPEIHGIRKYNDKYNPNPIKVETLFDAFTAAGKKAIIISSKNCSIDLIFRGHKVDQITTNNSQESVDTAKKILREGKYDLVLCYDGNYDSTMHAKGVFHEKSIAAMRDSIRWYLELVAVADEVWPDQKHLTAFLPDHGAHDLENGKGTHGSDQACDAIVQSFYRIK